MVILDVLREVDNDLRKLLYERSEEDIRKYILDLLRAASQQPGRASKFRVDYLLERMAELVQDLDQASAGFHEKRSRLMTWIDRGQSFTTKLLEPESDGKWLVTFDQVVSRVVLPDPTDPAAKEERQRQAQQAKLLWDKAADSLERNKGPGRGLIIPGNSL